MIDLSEISGLPIFFDEENQTITTSPEARFCSSCHISLKDLNPILLNKSLRYPEMVYREYKSLSNGKTYNQNFSYDVLVLPSGLLGIEYIKTHVYYSEEKEGIYDCMVEVLSGNLTVLMQKNAPKEDEFQFDTYVDEVIVFTLKRGERLTIPTGYYYTFFNTTIAPAVFAKVATHNHYPTDYAPFVRYKGLAYFLISKNAKVEIVANPRYKLKCKVKMYNCKRVVQEEQPYIHRKLVENKDPIYDFLFEEDFITNSFYASLN